MAYMMVIFSDITECVKVRSRICSENFNCARLRGHLSNSGVIFFKMNCSRKS